MAPGAAISIGILYHGFHFSHCDVACFYTNRNFLAGDYGLDFSQKNITG
jgi:hypothetical protein